MCFAYCDLNRAIFQEVSVALVFLRIVLLVIAVWNKKYSVAQSELKFYKDNTPFSFKKYFYHYVQ